jgi:hypothetical protein
MTYASACDKLNGRDSRKVGNNTYLERINSETVAVRLHRTHVVTIHADGSYTLNSGGWRTVTTKSRINDYAPARVTQRAGEWFVTLGGIEVDFRDGMTLTA